MFKLTQKQVPVRPLALMRRVFRDVLPDVNGELAHWRAMAETIPNAELRTQAIASMTSKKFHCQGGAVYACANLQQKHVLIPLIVALQTISDYLDNLCDRSRSQDEMDFRMLHMSMLDAVNPGAPLRDYYQYRDDRDDGGYLHALVRKCQSCIHLLPSYETVRSTVTELVSYYADLQVYKHIHVDLREQKLLEWWRQHQQQAPNYRWNEFAAATGSTLGMFMLFLAASDPNLTSGEVERIRAAYFPSVCALHILLDYLIDQEEDIAGGDLNFCKYYENEDVAVERIDVIADHARKATAHLNEPSFHRMIIEGLLALYLSDAKVRKQRAVKHVAKRLMRNSPLSRLFFWVSSMWIRKVY